MHLTSFFYSILWAISVNALAVSTTNDTQKPLRVGVLYEGVQLSDLAGLDLIGAQTPEIMAVVTKMNPSMDALMNLTTPMEFLYISSSLEPADITPAMHVKPTHTYENAPRDLDILFLGGPDPGAAKDASLKYMQEASKKTKVIITTCTGAMWLAKSGVLDGKNATTNRMMLEIAKKSWPDVHWQDQRWVIEDGHFDGAKIWTSGGAGCGVDMLIEFTDQTFDKTLVQLSCQGLDFPYANRSQFYTEPLAPLPTIGK